MSLHIIKNGLLDTIQDMGRYGYQQSGINPGGAMDNIAMRIANMLVGNDVDEAVIEMHFPAAEIEFEGTALIVLAGADLSASVNGEAIPLLHPIIMQKGYILRFGKRQTGTRSYLAVKGGFVADDWLHSKSTHLKVKAGGLNGRALQKNDRILLKEKHAQILPGEKRSFKILPWYANTSDLYVTNAIRFIPGNEYSVLDDASKQTLENENLVISRESDRMGYRLQSQPLQVTNKKEMISAAVTRGTMQLLPGGDLIILMADHQTTGGYPRMGHIISADIPSLAQMQAGDKFSLQQISLANAERLLVAQEMNLQQLQNACNFRLEEYFTTKK